MTYQTVEITKEIKIDVADQVVKFDHDIDVRVDYCRCEECGKDLDFKLESDNCGDIQITVARCNCEAET